jgi:hypothetical protein
MVDFNLGRGIIGFVADLDELDKGLAETKVAATATARDIAAEFTKAAKAPFPDGVAKGITAAGNAAKQTKTQLSEVQTGIMRATSAMVTYKRNVEETGVASSRAIRPLIGQYMALKSAIERAHGSVEQAGPEVQRVFKLVEEQVKRAKREVEDFEDAMSDVRVETREGGVAWRGLSDNLNIALGQYGRIQMQAMAVTAALTAGWQIGTKFLEVTGADRSGWESFLDQVKIKGRVANRELGEMLLLFGQLATGGPADGEALDIRLNGASYSDTVPLSQVQKKNNQFVGPATPDDAQIMKNLAITANRLREEERVAAEKLKEQRERMTKEALRAAEAIENEFGRVVTGGLRARLVGRRGNALDALMPAETETARFADEFAAAVAKGLAKSKQFDVALLTPARDAMRKLSDDYRANAMTMTDVYGGAIYSVETLFTDVLTAGVSGNLDEIDDAFKGFFKNLQRQIVAFLAQKAVMTLLQTFFGGGASTMGSGTSFAAAFGSNWTANMQARANGGTFEGGFRAFADGGVVSRPTLGLVGEGKYDEAVVPLPDGRAIRAVVQGANNGPSELKLDQVILIAPELLRAGQMSDDQIITVVGADIARNGRLRQVIRKAIN